MDCFGIIETYLKLNGFDGLFNRESECACGTDDLAPCGELCVDDCFSGYTQVEQRDGEDTIGEYHPKLCPDCKTKRDFGPTGFKLSCPKCGHENEINKT